MVIICKMSSQCLINSSGECSINSVLSRCKRHSPTKGRTELTGNRFNMKLVIAVALLCVAVSWAKPASTYTDKWDNINVDEILESQRLLKAYVDCLLERGRCTPDGKALKETLPDALEHECSKCTVKQKDGSEKVIRHLVNKRPDLWKELATKYDPDNIYQDRYKDKIQAAKGQ